MLADPTVPQVVRSYLAQLERALGGLPAEVRDDILTGIREELEGLDAAAAAARVEALGDPEFIAAEARAEVGAPPVAPVTPPAAERIGRFGGEPGWYPVLAALLVAFGGVVIPVIGWIVGLGLVWTSKTWRLRDKWVATLTPFVAVGLFAVVFVLTSMASEPDLGVTPNPLIPGIYSALWSSIVLVIPVNAVVGIWLLWRAKRSWGSETPPHPAQEPATNVRRPQASWYPPVTVLLIIGGGFVVPVVGWVAGVTMLWAANTWSVRDKWLGTLAGPLAGLVPAVLLLVARLWIPATGGGFGPFLLIILSALVLPTIANVLVGIRLLRRSAAPGGGAAPSGG